jgi:hypothetical protein
MSMLEFFLQEAEPEQIAAPGPLAIQPVVIDANALASDVYYAAANGGNSSLLLAASLGTIRLFTALHIYGKVYAELDNPNWEPWYELRHAARRIWEAEYLRKLRFVDVSDYQTADPRVLAIASKDEEDGPVAKLAALLGPCILPSEDKHMRGLGAAGADWRPLAVASRNAMMPTQALVVGVIPASAAWSGVSAGVGLLRAQPVLRLPVAVGGFALLGGIVWRLSKVKNWRERFEALGNVISQAADALQPVIDRYREARAILQAGTVVPESASDPLNRVAWTLATSPRPMLMSEVSRVLVARVDAVQLSPRHVGEILRGHSCFRHYTDGRWRIGFQAASRSTSGN